MKIDKHECKRKRRINELHKNKLRQTYEVRGFVIHKSRTLHTLINRDKEHFLNITITKIVSQVCIQ